MARAMGGRRNAASPSFVFLALFLFSFFASTASAVSAVLGIDLGTNFIKTVIVKPGTRDIVLTKDSKRKETGALAFKPASTGPLELGSFPERLYGGDALAISGRFPGDVYANLKPLLGIDPTNEVVVDEYKSRHPALNLLRTKTAGLLGFQSGAFSSKEQPWLVEELLAMELGNIRANAESMAGKGSKITDAVITIPPYYNADERRAIQRAAHLAGLTVTSLITDGLAVGLNYATDRDFPNVSKGGKAERHLIFDMGATSTSATVLTFQGREVRGAGRLNKTVQEVNVAGVGWDKTLGGNALNHLILERLITEFVNDAKAKAAGVSESKLRKHGRAISKLWKESERVRQVLSANNEVRSSFEELYDDVNFATKLSRAQFEELAAPFAEKVEAPIQQALAAAQLTLKDLDSIILFGGAVRTPFVKAKLEGLAGKSVEIRSNVNTDESAAFGAAFKAAGLSPLFRVKDIRSHQAAIYDTGTTQTDDGRMRKAALFLPTSLSGVPKQITFKNKEDFEFDFYQEIDGIQRTVNKIQTKNLTAGVKTLMDKFGCTQDEIATTFVTQLNAVDGLPEAISGSLSCTVDDSGKKGGLVDSVKGLFGGKKEQEPLKADSSSSSVSAKASGKASKGTKDDNVKTTRIETIKIDFVTQKKGNPVPTEQDIDRMVERLAAFDRSDKARVLRSEAFNSLEGFTYKARELLGDAGFEAFSTEAIRTQLSDLLSSTNDWLYGEGSTAATDVLKAKLAEFTKIVNPVKSRQKDAAGRPEKIKALQTSLNSTRKFLDNIAKSISEAAASASSAATAAASSASSAVSGEDLDDLEEPDTSSSADIPKPSALFSRYTKEDLTDLTASYEATLAWLKDKTAAQEKLPSYEDAVLSTTELEARAKALSDGMMTLLQKRITSLPPVAKSAKKKAASKTKSAKSAASSAAESVASAASQASASASSVVSGAAEAATDAAAAAKEKLTGGEAEASLENGEDEDAEALPVVGKAGQQPSQEEILEMIRRAKERDDVLDAETSSGPAHIEL